MADSILRLRVQSDEYDNKIKRAAEGIQQYAQKCREAGGTLEILDDGVLEFVQALGKMNTVATGSKQQLREMSNALTTLTTTYRGLTDEEKTSPFGKELAKGIQQLTERAGAAQDAMMDVQASIKNAASDTRAFDQIAQGMGVAMAGFQGLTGAGKLLGIEMGNDVEVIAKLQAAMAVTNSLTTIQTALQKQSALMQGVQAAQTALATAAQTAFATATGSATIAQAAFNAVAKANPYVLLATAIAAVGTALWAFSSASGDAKKKEEELAKAEEEATKKAQEQRDAFVNATASAMNTASRLSSLQVAYKNANSEIEKTNILRQAQNEFQKLGIECKNVHDAQTLLIRDGGKVIEMIRLQGDAAAVAALRMEAFKKSYQMLLENGYSSTSAAILAGYNDQVVDLDNRLNSLQSRIQSLKGSFTNNSNSNSNSNNIKSNSNNSDSSGGAEIVDYISLNTKKINKLSNEYVEASDMRRQAIEKEIQALQKENEKIQQLKDHAQGKPLTIELDGVVVKGDPFKAIDEKFRESATNSTTLKEWMTGIENQLKTASWGSDLYENLTEKLKDANTMSQLIQSMMEQGVSGTDLTNVAEQLKSMLLNGDIPDSAITSFIEKFNEKIKENGGVELTYNPSTGDIGNKDGKDENSPSSEFLKDFSSKLSSLGSGLNSVSSGLKNLGVTIPKEVDEVIGYIQAVSSVIQGVQTIISIFATSAQTLNTAAVATNTVTTGINTGSIIALTTAVWANTAVQAASLIPMPGLANGGIVPSFAHGGLIGKAAGGLMIPGNSFSGDNLRMPVDGGRGWIGVNSGELILNKSSQDNLALDIKNAESLIRTINNDGRLLDSTQQINLASQLTDSAMGGINLSATISGEDIRLAISNEADRWNNGEMVKSI